MDKLTYGRYPATLGQECGMQTVKISPKFRIVIPKAVREKLNLRPGQELLVYELDGSIRVEPPRSVKDLRGMAKGMKWRDDYRDHTERF